MIVTKNVYYDLKMSVSLCFPMGNNENIKIKIISYLDETNNYNSDSTKPSTHTIQS